MLWINWEGRMNFYSKAAMIFLVAVSAFNLGRYSVAFSGRATGWVAVILFIAALAVCSYVLLYE
jgi:hypothetical protein